MFLKLPNYLILNFTFIKKLFLTIIALICFSLSALAAEVPNKNVKTELSSSNYLNFKLTDPGDCEIITVQVSILLYDASLPPDDPNAYIIFITFVDVLVCEDEE